MVNGHKMFKLHEGCGCDCSFESHFMVTAVVQLFQDVLEMLLFLCMSQQVVDVTRNGGLIVGFGNVKIKLLGTRSPQLFP